jgi:hyperosmotically inducible protein
MYHRTLTMLVLTAFIGVAAVSSLQALDHHPMSSQQIKTKIEHDLLSKDIIDVSVDVTDGNVTLTGSVPNIWQKEEAANIAKELRDVVSVSNRIDVRSDIDDEQLIDEVQNRVNNYVLYTMYDIIQARVHNGIVTLSGEVTQPYKAQDIERMVSKLPGVQAVNNEIKVLPASISDDQIRNEIATRIYENAVFSNYAFESHPPIHIIVENGRVTLYGYVRSKIESRMAETISRSTFGVHQVKNEMEVAG